MATAYLKLASNPAAAAVQYKVTAALVAFIGAVFKTCPGSCSNQHNGGGSLQASIRQQLQASGLLQQLPPIMDAAAAGLMALAAKSQQELLSVPTQQQSGPDMEISTSNDGAVLHAAVQLNLYNECLNLWPYDSTLLLSAGPAAPAALRIAAAFMSCCGWRCGSLQSPQLAPKAAIQLLPRFLPAVALVTHNICTMLQAAEGVNSDAWYLLTQPYVQQLLESECAMPLLAALISCQACAQLEVNITDPGANSSSNCSNGFSPAVLLQPTSCLQQLFQCFGVNSLTALCAGRTLRKKHPGLLAGANSMLEVYADICIYWTDHADHHQQQQQLLTASQERQLLLLLPALLLHCAASVPWPAPGDYSSTATEVARPYLSAIPACTHGLQRWRQLMSLQSTAAAAPAPAAAAASTPVAGCTPTCGLPLPAEWLQEALPLLLRFAEGSMQLVPDAAMLATSEAHTQRSGGSHSSSTSSSSSAVGSSDGSSPLHAAGCTPGVPPASTTGLLTLDRPGVITVGSGPGLALGNAGHIAALLCAVLASLCVPSPSGNPSASGEAGAGSSSTTCTNSSSASSSSGSSASGSNDPRPPRAQAGDAAAESALVHQSVVGPHALQLLKVLEAFARIAAAASAASNSASGDTSIQLSYIVHTNTVPMVDQLGYLFSNTDAPLVLLAAAAGANSPEHEQLYSLLGSMLKADRAAGSVMHDWEGSIACSVARAAVAMLENALHLPAPVRGCSNQAASLQLPAPATEAGSCSTPHLSSARGETEAAAAAAAADASGPTPDADHAPDAGTAAISATPAAASLLPALYLFGRCCLQLKPFCSWGEVARITPPTQGLLGCLRHRALAQHLSAAGYNPQHMQQQLQQLLALLPPSQDSKDHKNAEDPPEQASSAAGAAEMQSQLQCVGAVLTSVAVMCVCNNPSCSNVAGRSELGLVSGRSCVCAGCLTGRYCSRDCQRQAWKQHKPMCRALAGAAAASAAAGGT